jgi:hypothetical protein
MHVDIDEDELPDGWIVSSNHSSHVGITRGDDPRHHVAAHPMAPQTDADGWFAHARPGTDKIDAEADPIEEVVDAMIAAAQQFEQTGEYKVKRRGSVIEKYSSDATSETESASHERQDEEQTAGQDTGRDQTQTRTQKGLDYWATDD